ncbi:MAG: carboxypeptidase regulatory-like domain-containing protein, partial [Marinilabiliaceae bacterium]|nr:carboxypeptidase regulatory-like domain-containing protein [Marinilabiliaceae bacterium]
MKKFLILTGALLLFLSMTYAQIPSTKPSAKATETIQIDKKKSETVETGRVRLHEVGELTLQQKQEKYMQLSPELRSMMRKPDFLKSDKEKQRKGSNTLRTYRGETAFAHNFFEDAWVSFDVDNINGQAFFAPWGLMEQPFSGAQVGDFIYVYGTFAPWWIEHTTFFVLDRETGAIISEVVKPQFYETLCNGLAYDYTTETMYLISENELFTVDLATGDATSLGMMSGHTGTVISIACDLDGNMFAVTISDPANFYSVNKSTGALTLIGSTGIDASYAQTMGFDLIDGTLYWLHYSGETGGSFRTIDVSTGMSTVIEGSGYAEDEYSCFFIPYLADPSAPAAPSGYTVTPGAAGALTADLAWTNPTLTVSGDPLTNITEVNVYENNSVIYTQTNPAPGSAGSYSHTTATAGFKTYKVTPENAFGEGISATQTHWIGHDVPAAPTALQGEEDEFAPGEVNLSWTAPTTGLNGAYFTTAGLTYTIVRNPGNNTLATGYTSTTYNDDEGLSDGAYTYIVTAVNNSGDGGSASVKVLVGDLCEIKLVSTGPYSDSWDGNAHFTLEVDGIDYGQYGIIYPGESLTYKEEFAYIPPGELKIYWNGGYWEGECGIEVYDILDDLIFSVEGLPGGVTNQLLFTYDWFCTPPDYELRATTIVGPSMMDLGDIVNYTTDVFSKGDVTLTGSEYSVKLFENGTLVETLPGVAIAYEETKTFTFTFTAATAGLRVLHAEIDLPLDEFPNNNTTPDKRIFVDDGISNMIDICVGDGTHKELFPINHYYRASLAQFMYHPNDLGIYGGDIRGITLKSSIVSSDIAPNRIRIWAAETTQNDLSSYVPFSEFFEVMDKVISFPQGDNDVEMEFDIPYLYNGGNLVLYIYYYNSPYYDWEDYYYLTPTDGIRSRMNYADPSSGELDFENPGTQGGLYEGEYYPNICFNWNVAGLGSLTGIVDNDSGVLLEGATISITDGGAPKIAKTDEDGVYLYPGLPDGTYTLTASAHGHYDSTPVTVTIFEDIETVEDVTLIEEPKVVVSGTVTGSDGSGPIEDVVITLSGYNPYETTTNAAGFYTIDVYGGHTYAFEATAKGWLKYTHDLVVGNVNVTHDFQMDEKIIPPGPVTALKNSDETIVHITWEAEQNYEPVYYVLDDGDWYWASRFIDGEDGWKGNEFNVGVLGEITSIEIGGLHEGSVNTSAPQTIDIFDANRQLVGTSLPFTWQYGFYEVEWTTVEFANPIPFDGTFYAMVHWEGFSSSDYTPYLPFSATSPSTDSWSVDAGGNWIPAHQGSGYPPSIAMVRVHANAEPDGKSLIFGPPKNNRSAISQLDNFNELSSILRTTAVDETLERIEPGVYKIEKEPNYTSRVRLHYNVYRLEAGEETFPALWEDILLGTTELECFDNNFGTLDPGVYKYAVTSVYTGDVESVPSFSKDVPKDMETPFCVIITTNSGDPVNGAQVVLIQEDGNNVYNATANTPEVCWDFIWKGIYTINITLDGFLPYEVNGEGIWNDNPHNAELIEIIYEPVRLEVEVDECYALFSWNNAPDMVNISVTSLDPWGDGSG